MRRKERAPASVEQRVAAAKRQSRAVRMGFILGVLIGALFIGVVLAPWAAQVAIRRAQAAHETPASERP